MAKGTGTGVNLDSVIINIESKTKGAAEPIAALSTELATLKEAIKGGFNNLNKLSDALNKLDTASKSISDISKNLKGLDQVTESLSGLVNMPSPKGFKGLVNTMEKLRTESEGLATVAQNLGTIDTIVEPLQKLTTIGDAKGLRNISKDLKTLGEVGNVDGIVGEMQKIPQIVEPLSKLSEILNPKGFKHAIDNLAKLPDVISKFDTTAMENLRRVSEELSQSLTPLAEKMQAVANGYSAFSKIQNTFGKSASTSVKYMKQSRAIVNSLGNSVKKVASSFASFGRNVLTAFGSKAVNSMKKFNSKFKQVYLSLLGTRTLFTMIRKAASEYEAFDVTLQKFTQNIWRAFGAQLAPIIEYAMELFKQFVRVVYSVVYALTGIDLIARANEKAMAGWGKAAKDTLGNLQKFDDLNVVEFPSSGSGDDNSLIELDKIDLTPIQKIIDWVRKLKQEIKEALDTGEWYNVGVVFSEGINDGIDFLLTKIPDLRNVLTKVATQSAGFLNGIFDNTDFYDIGRLLSESIITGLDAITTFFSTIHWDSIGKGISDALLAIDYGGLLNSILNLFGSLGTGIQTILENIEFKEIGEKIGQAIRDVDWKKVWKKVVSVLKTVISSADDLFDGLLGTDNGAELALLGFTLGKFLTSGIVKAIATTIGGNLLGGIGNSIGKLMGIAPTGSSSSLGKVSATSVTQGIKDLVIIVGSLTALVAAIGLLTQIPGFKTIVGDGISSLKTVFLGLGEIALPVAIFGAGIVVLSKVNISSVLTGLLSLTTILLGMPAVLVALGAFISIPYFSQFLSVGIESIVSVFKGLEEIILPLGVVSALIVGLGFATPAIVLSGLAGLALVIGGLELVLVALGALNQIPGFSWIVGEGGKVLEQLGEILGNFAGSIVKGIAVKTFEGFDELGTHLTNFMNNAVGFFEGLNKINASTVGAMGTLADAILKFTTSSFINGLSSWIKGDVALSSFGEDLADFGPSFKTFATSVGNIDSSIVTKAADAVASISKFIDLVPNVNGLKQLFTGEKSLSKFGEDLASFGPNFAAYAESVSGINGDVVKKSADAAESLATFADLIPDSGGVFSWFAGDNDLETFGKDLAAFGADYKKFYNEVKSITQSKIDAIIAGLVRLTVILDDIKENKLNTTLKNLGEGLASQASNFTSFFNSVFSPSYASNLGTTFGNKLGTSIASAVKNKTKINLQLTSSSGEVLSNYSIKGYATGGLPESGQYFFARENGIPEYVGSMGSQAAVANNTQIVEGIRQGVLDAMLEANGNNQTPIIINLGNKRLYEGMVDYNRTQQNKYGTINLR